MHHFVSARLKAGSQLTDKLEFCISPGMAHAQQRHAGTFAHFVPFASN